MIVTLKHVTLLCVAHESARTLNALHELGVVHLNLSASDSEPFRDAQARLAAARRAQGILADARSHAPVFPTVMGPHKAHGYKAAIGALLHGPLPKIEGAAPERVDAILRLAGLRQELVNEIERLEKDIALYEPYGDFDVTLPARLSAQGLPVQLFRIPVDTTFVEPDGVLIEEYGADQAFTYSVMVGDGSIPEPCERLDLPEVTVSTLRELCDASKKRVAIISGLLIDSSHNADAQNREIARLNDVVAFANAVDNMQAGGAVAWITGWLPAESSELLRAAAAQHAWGLLLRDPEPGELPPTLLRPPRLFRPVLALFEALGISPAYAEADVSVPFFCFFGIFFAMLVGDGGYGALIGLLAWRMRKKFPKAPGSPFVLLYVFAVATMAWGALSNTWFGAHPKFAANAVSLWLSDPEKGINNTMLVCFTLGVAHLSVARVWNAISLFPDTKFLAQVGWVGVIWFMYCMACSIVGIFPAPRFIYAVFGVALLLVFCFTLKKEELRTNGIELGMMPLTIVSSLGDIISYVRLFAVGLASVKVAENFNDMAINNGLPLWAKIIPMILILLIGHGLNFLMAGLSILVHAVRLNTLEFSNHKGVTWSGFAFKPFKRKAETA